ncbi:MAG: exonuclease SbcCD subunit D [Treponema sp.]
MKLLHTADLHLGKSLHEMPLLPDQKKILSDIIRILCTDRYAALLIAGDIYDRAIPPADALSLLSWFLSEVRTACPDTAIFMIPGNHDSAQRLAFAGSLLQQQRIYIAENHEAFTVPTILSQDGEQAAVFMLPFLHYGAFSQSAEREKIGDSQAEMARFASAQLKAAVNPAIPSVLLAHLFTIGGKTASSERTFIGTAEYVDPALFSYFTYTALGHLHRFQRVSDRMYYAGSPLAYAFDEADSKKYVLSITIDCNTPGFPLTIDPIPLHPEHKLSRLTGPFADFLEGDAFKEHTDDFLEITLTDTQVVTNPMQLLRSRFPLLLSIRQRGFSDFSPAAHEQASADSGTAETPRTMIENFLTFEQRIGSVPDAQKQALFEKLCREADYET